MGLTRQPLSRTKSTISLRLIHDNIGVVDHFGKRLHSECRRRTWSQSLLCLLLLTAECMCSPMFLSCIFVHRYTGIAMGENREGVEWIVRFGTILMRIIMLTESRAIIMGSQSVLFKLPDYYGVVPSKRDSSRRERGRKRERERKREKERERERERAAFLLQL